MKKDTLNEYLHEVHQKLATREVVSKNFSDIREFPLIKGQCFYILNYKEKTVPIQKNIEEMLGYTPDEFNFEWAVNFFHPDDYNIVTLLIKATVAFLSEHNVSNDVSFFVTYRVRHKNGNYIAVLRQSNVYESDEKGRIISNLSVLSDISFISKSNKVEWRFDAPGLDKEKFKKYVTKEYSDFFSEREMDIIRLLKLGKKSSEIAEKLHISKHTVDTHRRNILKKSNCENTIELLNFCDSNGLI